MDQFLVSEIMPVSYLQNGGKLRSKKKKYELEMKEQKESGSPQMQGG